MKIDYTFAEITEEIDMLKNTFDCVRLVSPDVCKICNIQKVGDNILFKNTDDCYSVWGIKNRCENCISARAQEEKGLFTKLEYINNNIFLIHSKCVCIEGTFKALEMVMNVTNSLNFDNAVEEKIKTSISQFNNEINLDTLTKVYNRRYMEYNFRDIIRKEKKNKKPVHMAIIDVDYFKDVNDNYGHLAGDCVLKTVADKIKELVITSKNDYVVRFGGDEFIVMSAERDFNEFKDSLEELILYFSKTPIDYDNGSINITLSIGAVNGSISKMYNLKDILTLSDARLYAAKANGRNTIV